MFRGQGAARVLFLLAVAAGFAALSNLAASTQRKLAWIGSYPRALEVGAPGAGPAAVPAVAAPGIAMTPSDESRAVPGAAVPVDAAARTLATYAGKSSVAAAPPAEGPAPSGADLAKSFPPHPDKPAVEITPEDVRLLHRGQALFLDARRSSVYAEGHIQGARSFPVWESDIDERVKALYEEGRDQQAPIVAYCSGGNCEDSHMLAQKLYMVGFDNVLVYKDGFPDWQERGLPVAKGTNP